MGVQFGIWNFDDSATPEQYLDRARSLIAPYGPEGDWRYRGGPVDILYSRFSTTEQLSPQEEPAIAASGAALVWDGRLDNVSDLAVELRIPSSPPRGDAAVAVAAYERWKQDCLKHFTGDWSLTVWDPRDRSLLLATDVLGVRPIYYLVRPKYVLWGTVLDPLILLSDHKFSLDEEYLAGWISSLPNDHLTPFREIRRVPPASIVAIRPGGVAIRRYWDFEDTPRIRYVRDAEYEEHFLSLFAQSVRRRVRSCAPLLAELSGGMDSAAIVCMADRVGAISPGASRVDTVSYYNDSEPNWDEKPWFGAVEQYRGKEGLHIDVCNRASTTAGSEVSEFRSWPGATRPSMQSELINWMVCHSHRVVLSGMGGDEFLGGVPTAIPELENLLARGRMKEFARQLMVWALLQRKPWIFLFHDTVAGFLPSAVRRRPVPPWLEPEFAKRNRTALSGYTQRWRVFGPLPSFQENMEALASIRRQLAATELCAGYPFEKRYPYLDRDLLQFLFAVPREQLVRPGERRSLMRRALKGIVPDVILQRRRKAYVTRSPIALAAKQYRELFRASADLVTCDLRIVRRETFLENLRAAAEGRGIPVIPLMRTAALEYWLRALDNRGLLRRAEATVIPPEWNGCPAQISENAVP